jgi:hypothetical protein
MPLAANAVIMGNLGHANHVTTITRAINRIQRILLTNFFIATASLTGMEVLDKSTIYYDKPKSNRELSQTGAP